MPKTGGHVAPERISDVTAAAHILAARGVVDGFGHVSMRHPDAPDRYMVSRTLAPALVTPADIVEYDLESEACDPAAPKGFLERFIHGQIYKARPDVCAVVHSHSPSVIPFGLTKAPMQACFHNAAFLAQGVPVFDIACDHGATDMLVSDNDKGVAFAECLSDKPVALMRAHGSVACGPSLEVAVFRAVYTEVSARVQHWALALAEDGENLASLSKEEGVLADVPNQTAGLRAWDLWRAEIRDQAGW
jgi:ribulose-5-phosphate 4-epimerase/fuculose-1-phosphate aldolase